VAEDPERSAEESKRRARTRLRRYCVSLGIDRLATLTFRCRRCDEAPCCCSEGPDRPKHDELAFVDGCIEAFRRAVRLEFGDVAMVVVVEHHEDGHLHVHVGIGQFLDKYRFRTCWPHGYIDLRRLKAKALGKRETARAQARKTAAYLAKYVTKERHDPFRKAYSTTKGLIAPPRRARFMTEAQCERWLLVVLGGEVPSYRWSSDEMESWDAPPCRLLFYDG
jgi:hypothetical protein